MSQRSKKFAAAAAAALSAVVFASTALAASNNVSGYERVRESMFKYIDVANNGNFTLEADISIFIDGADQVSFSYLTKRQDESNHSETESASFAGETFSRESSRNDGISIDSSTDLDGNVTYYKNGVANRRDRDYPYSSPSSLTLTENQQKLARVLFDLLAGDAKNYCAYDGDKITMRMERGQIPEIAQVSLAVLSEQISDLRTNDGINYHYPGSPYSAQDAVYSGLAGIFNGAFIDSVEATGVIDDDGMLSDAEATVTLSGYDRDNGAHSVSIAMSYRLTDVGATVAEPIDLTGKAVVDNSVVYDVDFEDLYRKYLNGELTVDDIPESAWKYIGKVYGDYAIEEALNILPASDDGLTDGERITDEPFADAPAPISAAEIEKLFGGASADEIEKLLDGASADEAGEPLVDAPDTEADEPFVDAPAPDEAPIVDAPIVDAPSSAF
jgi:hypothetical protein